MTQILSEVFYTFLITSVIGFIIVIVKTCYKSKCSSIDLCCIKIIRNIDAEVKEDLELGNTDESKK
jgi:hypothetical protein